jgi:hypothetical protein
MERAVRRKPAEQHKRPGPASQYDPKRMPVTAKFMCQRGATMAELAEAFQVSSPGQHRAPSGSEEPSWCALLEHLVEARTPIAALGTADASIAVLLDDLPAPSLGYLAQAMQSGPIPTLGS